MQTDKALKLMVMGSCRDHAALVVVVVEAEAAMAEAESEAEDKIVDGVVAVVRGAELASVALGVVEAETSVVEDTPPVITEPVMGMGVVMRDSETLATAADEAEPDGEPGAEIRVMENAGLVLPESPNTVSPRSHQRLRYLQNTFNFDLQTMR